MGTQHELPGLSWVGRPRGSFHHRNRNPTGSTSELSSCVAVTSEAIPTLSQLGLIVMAQILTVTGTLVFGRRSLPAKN